MASDAAGAVDAVFRADWGRIIATLIRLLGDFDLAEEAAQEAFAVAVDHWRESGIPESPRAWIVQTARNKAIDRIRRRARHEATLHLYTATASPDIHEPDYDQSDIPDDRLRLIFTCCHPALALEARYPMLRGTIRDQETKRRRPFLRFFACEQDLSDESPDAPLPDAVAKGVEPYLVVGAIAGG